MKYARILMAVASEIWAMHPAKLQAMIEFLAMQAAGAKFDASGIEARIAPQTASATARRAGAVAILPLRGVIANRMNMLTEFSGGTSNEAFSAMFRAARDDESIKAIVLDVDSPGGTVQGTEELSHLIADARGSKPIVAQIDGTAASAAYWIASAADDVVITPTGWAGSIGAMQIHDDISAMMENEGVKRTMIVSSPHKNETAAHLPLTEEARAHLEDQVQLVDRMFVDRIAANRSIAASKVRADFGLGRMIIGSGAVAAGMADRVATMQETLTRFGAGAPSGSSIGAGTPRRNRARAAL